MTEDELAVLRGRLDIVERKLDLANALLIIVMEVQGYSAPEPARAWAARALESNMELFK